LIAVQDLKGQAAPRAVKALLKALKVAPRALEVVLGALKAVLRAWTKVL
jgi:hypothetical protein